MSVEKRWARRLGLEVGDRLTFNLQGRRIEGEVRNLRAVNWLRLEPNFLVSLNEAALAGAPKNYIGAFRLPDPARLPELTRAIFAFAPNISVIDLRPIFEEGRRLLGALAGALQLIAGACALAGFFILSLALRLDRPRRRQEAALLRALGVEQRGRRQIRLIEALFSGVMTSILVLIGAVAIGSLGGYALELPLTLSPLPLAFLALAGLTLAPLQLFFEREGV